MRRSGLTGLTMAAASTFLTAAWLTSILTSDAGTVSRSHPWSPSWGSFYCFKSLRGRRGQFKMLVPPTFFTDFFEIGWCDRVWCIPEKKDLTLVNSKFVCFGLWLTFLGTKKFLKHSQLFPFVRRAGNYCHIFMMIINGIPFNFLNMRAK